MKKILTAIAAAVFIVSSSICFASYVIHLKDGRKVATDQYWEEGEQIKFKKCGGIMGIQKDQVKEIEEKEDLPEEKTVVVKPETPSGGENVGDVKKAEATDAAEKAKSTEQAREQQKPEAVSEEEKKEEKKTDIARYKKEKTVLMEKYRKARQGFREARKAKDKLGIIAAKQQIKDAEKEMAALVRKVKKEAGGLIPPWWFEPEREEQVEAPEWH